MHSIPSHPANKMLPKETAHAHIYWHIFMGGRWVVEDKGEISCGSRKVYKHRHKKKAREHGKRIMKTELRESYSGSSEDDYRYADGDRAGTRGCL